jgi:uncharacterized membrane protein YccC
MMALKLDKRIMHIRELGNDHLRIPLQTVCAVALAYIGGRLLTSGDVSWTVFSAIFVVQASAGGTWRSAVDRTLGAVLGSILGCALMLAAIQFAFPEMVAMMIGVAIMSVATALRPGLSYGLVTVALITVTPQPELFRDAIEKVWAVALGSLSAALVGSSILPVSIRHRARQDLKETARALALWLHASTEALLDRKVGPIDIHHQKMDHALEDARATLWSSGNWVPRGRLHTGIEKCRNSILALRYSIAILDRLGWTPLPQDAHETLREPLMTIAHAAERLLERIAEGSITDGERDVKALTSALDGLHDAISRTLATSPIEDTRAREHLHAIGWAWATLASQMRRVACPATEESGQGLI